MELPLESKKFPPKGAGGGNWPFLTPGRGDNFWGVRVLGEGLGQSHRTEGVGGITITTMTN